MTETSQMNDATYTKARFFKCALQVNPADYIQHRGQRQPLTEDEYNRQLLEAALEAGADDVVSQEDGSVDVYTSFAEFLSVNEALTEAGFRGDEAEVAMIPSIMAPITDVETAQKVLRLIDALEDLDDVQNVYHNAEISDEIMQQLG
jgi:transcriptional/translational regulatory protein YebC/TACO1